MKAPSGVKQHRAPTIEGIRRNVLPILARYGVRRAGLFGSVVRGELSRRSDIDILLELERPIGLFEFVGLKLELEESLGRKVDLVEYDSIKPLLRERILKEEVRIL